MMTRIGGVALCAALSFASPLMAQDRAQGLKPVDMEQRLALADKLIVAMKLESQLDTVIPLMVNALLPVITPGNTGKEPELRKILSEEMLTSFATVHPDFVMNTRAVYARNFTTTELQDLVTFYASPTGKALVEKTPAITKESLESGMMIGRKAAQDALPRVFNRMRAAQLAVPKGT